MKRTWVMLLVIALIAVFGLALVPAASACEPEAGCTPGFWKNHHEDWSATGYAPHDDFDAAFGVDWFDPDVTLDEALRMRGGGIKALARHGVAGMLNALHPEIGYGLTHYQVILLVQDGTESAKDVLEFLNEIYCPL